MGHEFNGHSSMKHGVGIMILWPLDGELHCMDDSEYGVLVEMRGWRIGAWAICLSWRPLDVSFHSWVIRSQDTTSSAIYLKIVLDLFLFHLYNFQLLINCTGCPDLT